MVPYATFTTAYKQASKSHTGIEVDAMNYGWFLFLPRGKGHVLSMSYYIFGLGLVRWAEFEDRRDKANIPLIELVSVASKDCEKNLLEAGRNKNTKRNPWNIVVHCWMNREWWPIAISRLIDNL